MDADLVIVGAGVIGIALSYSFSKRGHSVILLEKESSFGMGVSSRNTEQIHAGIYYAEGTLKARLCLLGKKMLYEFCNVHDIAHKRLGKLFLAITDEEIERLEVTKVQAIANGLMDLKDLDEKQIKKLEPLIYCKSALLSPSSGIVDSYGFMQTLMRLSEMHGTTYVGSSPVVGAETCLGGWKVRVGGIEPVTLTSRTVINSAGLYSIDLSKKVFPEREIPTLNPVKGGYLRYSGKSPVSHIVYPAIMPGQIEERVDATPDISGSLRFGPSIEKTFDIEDFSLSDGLIDRFYPSISRYIPKLDKSKLYLDQAGIRPKIKIDGVLNPDFIFEWAPENTWLDLWGMESPGLTASLAIGEHVHQLFKDRNLV